MVKFDTLQMMSCVDNNEILDYLEKGNYKLTECITERVESLENLNVLLSFSNGVEDISLSFAFDKSLGALTMVISKSSCSTGLEKLASRIDFTYIRGYEVEDLLKHNLIG